MRYIFFFFFFFFSDEIFSQENTFIRTYNLPGMQGGLALAIMEDGGFVGTGQHNDNGCKTYAYRIDECGNIIWFNLYNDGGGTSIDDTHDKGVIIAQNSGRLLKIDSLGNPQWERSYADINGYMTSVIQVSDLGYFAGGSSGKIIKTDSLGVPEWGASVSSGDIHALGQFPNQDLMYFAWNGTSFWIGRVSLTGVLIWENEYSSGGASGDAHNSWSGEASNPLMELLSSSDYSIDQPGVYR